MAVISTEQLSLSLHSLLGQLKTDYYPVIPTPEGAKKRGAIALIIRFKPSHHHWPPPGTSPVADIDEFFSQDWVHHGNPEILFIKRAARKGDPWTSHIAMPGGMRDPNDPDDQAVAVRETWEETGLDLNKYAIPCGNLPQRIVTAHWGKKPLLVLCPYIFLLTTHDIPPLHLQPTEVASSHWVPLLSLQSPERRTVVFQNVSHRFSNEETGIKKWMLSLTLGNMTFAAISLLPSESLHSVEPAVESSLQDNRHAIPTRYDRFRGFMQRLWNFDLFDQLPAVPPQGPLLLWGLTLGALSDFLDLLPPHNALTVWKYPNFTALDVRFVVWLMTYRFQHRKRIELQSGHIPPFGFGRPNLPPPNTLTSSAKNDLESSGIVVARPDETGLHGLGTGSIAGGTAVDTNSGRNRRAVVSTMLEGFVDRLTSYVLPRITDRGSYYAVVRRAVAIALLGRASILLVLAVLVVRRMKRRMGY